MPHTSRLRDARSRLLAALLVAAASLPLLVRGQPASLDEQILQAAKLPSDTPGLLEFFRLRSLHDGDGPYLKKLVQQLGGESFKEREQASKELLLRGPIALPYLQEALKTGQLEVIRRAEGLIRAIEALGPEQPVAAARLLTQRRAHGAIAALLGYLATAQDEWVEDEIVACLGQLAVKEGAVDDALLSALQGPAPAQRGAAAYVLGRRADTSAREAVRQRLADANVQVRQQAAAGLTGKRLPHSVRDATAFDRTLLKTHNVPADEPALLDFLRQRTLGDDDVARLRRLIRELGDASYTVRAEASRQLVKEGTPALVFLKEAEAKGDAEVTRRARLCIDDIKKGPGPALPIAVIHQLALPPAREHSPAAAIRVLLGYVPFADDEAVEDEAINALTLLCAREEKIDPLLPLALADAAPARRGAAAAVLGRVGTREHLPAMRRLLQDPAAQVRFRAAQGLLAAKDKAGVPALIALLQAMPHGQLWQVEDQLHRIAGEQAPPASVADGSPAARARAAKLWDQWWLSRGSQLDLTRVGGGEAFLGLYLICEYDSAVGMPGGQIWETAGDGQPRWKVSGLLGAMDAQLLPNGRVLVAENSVNRVTERDKDSNIVWEHRIQGQGNPIACQRLPNGNTFIATYNHVMELSPEGRTVYSHSRGPSFYLFSAHKTRQGRIACMTAQGMILEIDPVTGKEIKQINLGPNGGWCSVEALPTGRYLVATMNNSLVREIDAQGKTHWQATFPGVFRATRLPNGNTLVASMTTKKVAELDRTGQPRWEKVCEGRPWSVHWR
jgi:HEAT repeat protein